MRMYNPPPPPFYEPKTPKELTKKDKYKRAVFYIVIYLIATVIYSIGCKFIGLDMSIAIAAWIAITFIGLTLYALAWCIVTLHDWAFGNND